jgi:hypothetical protein
MNAKQIQTQKYEKTLKEGFGKYLVSTGLTTGIIFGFMIFILDFVSSSLENYAKYIIGAILFGILYSTAMWFIMKSKVKKKD